MIDVDEVMKAKAPIRYWIATKVWKGELPMHYACETLADVLENLPNIAVGKRILFPNAYFFPVNRDSKKRIYEIVLKDDSGELEVLAEFDRKNRHGNVELMHELKYINGGDIIYQGIISKGKIATHHSPASTQIYLEGLLYFNSRPYKPNGPRFRGMRGPMLPVNR